MRVFPAVFVESFGPRRRRSTSGSVGSSSTAHAPLCRLRRRHEPSSFIALSDGAIESQIFMDKGGRGSSSPL